MTQASSLAIAVTVAAIIALGLGIAAERSMAIAADAVINPQEPF